MRGICASMCGADQCGSPRQKEDTMASRLNPRSMFFGLLYTMTIIWAAPVLSQTPDFVPVRIEPRMIKKAKLEFPESAAGSLVTGRIWVKILVGNDGVPIKTDIIKREPDIAYMFDDVSRQWAMACRFSPAIDSSGNPVAVWVSVPLNYKIEGFQPPAVTRVAVPDYPEEAREMGMEGWVGVAVLLGEAGSAVNGKTVIVAREPSTTKVFDAAAIAAVRASEFRPAEDSGRRIEAWCFVKIVFKIPEQ